MELSSTVWYCANWVERKLFDKFPFSSNLFQANFHLHRAHLEFIYRKTFEHQHAATLY